MTVDRDGAVALVRAADATGVGRYVIVSSVGAEAPPEGDDVFSVYLRAKAEADQAVMAATSTGRSCVPGRSPTSRGRGPCAWRPSRSATT